jgi:hypothetical protein
MVVTGKHSSQMEQPIKSSSITSVCILHKSLQTTHPMVQTMHTSVGHAFAATRTQSEERNGSPANPSGVLRDGNRPRFLPVPNTNVTMVYGCHGATMQRPQTCSKSQLFRGCVANKRVQLGCSKYTLGLYIHNRRQKEPLSQRPLYLIRAKPFNQALYVAR